MTPAAVSADAVAPRGIRTPQILLLASGCVVLLCALLWAGDQITADGERAIYTVTCRQGAWVGETCSGQLVADVKYRFHAYKDRAEVWFWTFDAREPTGKLTGCRIDGGWNWSCAGGADASKSIALDMRAGKAIPDAQDRTRPFHAVSKARWLLLRLEQ